jgi:hypothetical protein
MAGFLFGLFRTAVFRLGAAFLRDAGRALFFPFFGMALFTTDGAVRIGKSKGQVYGRWIAEAQPDAGARAAKAMGQIWGKPGTDRDEPRQIDFDGPWKISD